MGRKRGGMGGGGMGGGMRSAPSKRPSAPTKTVAPAKPTSSQNVPAKTQASQPANKTASSATPTAAPGQRGSLMRDIGTSAAGSLVGVMGAHAIMNAFSGTEKEEQVQQLVSNDPMFGPCNPQYQGFLKCLENNTSSIGSCQWAYDMFNQCGGSQGQQQQPESGKFW